MCEILIIDSFFLLNCCLTRIYVKYMNKIAPKMKIMMKRITKDSKLLRTALFFMFGLFFLLIISCESAEKDVDEAEFIQNSADSLNEISATPIDQDLIANVEIPTGYTILGEAIGDLDGDGLDEKAIVFDTERAAEMGTERELRIYVDQEGVWSLWHTCVGPVLSSESGGLLGDPFESIEITGGNLLISHYGGSSDRWSYLHEFHYSDQNWFLVGATLISYRSCEYSETYTYDLMKGTGFHSYQTEECNGNGETIHKEMGIEEYLTVETKEKKPTMDHFQPGETKANVRGNQELYFY